MKIFYSRLFKFYTFGHVAFADTNPFQLKVFQLVHVSELHILPVLGDTKNCNMLAKLSKAILDLLLSPSPTPTLFRRLKLV